MMVLIILIINKVIKNNNNIGAGKSAVSIASGYSLDGRGIRVRVPVGARFFSSPRRSDRFWVPANLLSSGYQGRFP
jgi:hypothetical protein